MTQHILLQEVELTAEQVVEKSTHDIESIVWVLLNCIMCNVYHQASQ
jgi:hypothetical protein